jgi:phosphatidate cytidylyltransferase
VLKKRLLTAAVLIPVVIYMTIFLPSVVFRTVSALIVLMGAWEWSELMGSRFRWQRIAFMGGLFSVFLAVYFLVNTAVAEYLLLITLLWWVVVSIDLLSANRLEKVTMQNRLWVRMISGLIVLTGGWFSVVQLHALPQNGPTWVLLLFFLIWTADSLAYFTGRKLGKHKLAPVISPGKSWEGFWGGLIGVGVLAFAGIKFLPLSPEAGISFVILCLVVTVFSVLGDLFESAAKRRAQVKDSGQLLPGHGGVLDRIDSLLAAAPVFTLGLLWFYL